METYMVFSTTIQYSISGLIQYTYALWISLFIIIGTVAGLTLISKAVKRLGRTSLLVFLLVGVLLAAAVVTVIIDAGEFREMS